MTEHILDLDFQIPRDCDFENVGYNNSHEYDCTPKVGFFTDFVGILINSQEEVHWPRGATLEDCDIDIFGDGDCPLKLRLAGLYRAPDPTGYAGPVAYKIRVVAVNQDTAEAFCGTMDFFGEFSPAPGYKYDADALEHVYFNVDLIHNLGIPITAATYTVYATLGRHKSNIVTVKTSLE